MEACLWAFYRQISRFVSRIFFQFPALFVLKTFHSIWSDHIFPYFIRYQSNLRVEIFGFFGLKEASFFKPRLPIVQPSVKDESFFFLHKNLAFSSSRILFLGDFNARSAHFHARNLLFEKVIIKSNKVKSAKNRICKIALAWSLANFILCMSNWGPHNFTIEISESLNFDCCL